MSLNDLISGYRAKEISPVEAVQASLDRIEEVNPYINAVYYTDRHTALKEAKRSEKRWKGKKPLGPMDGAPTTVKDLLPTIGMPGGFLGAASETGETPDVDHPTVARMREAGAVIIGKNTMCDYGIIASGVSSRFGPTRNPWDLTRTSGASSSGAAASVAAGIEPVSVGTDIVGSIRLPASYCGLAGLKPSRGRVPYYFPNSPAVVAGPLARNVTDLALHMNVLTLPDNSDFTALPYNGCDYANGLRDFSLEGKRVLVICDLGLGEKPAPSTIAAINHVAKAIADQGADVEAITHPVFERGGYREAELFYKVRYLSALSKNPDDVAIKSSTIWEWTREALNLSATDYYNLSQSVDKLRETTANLIAGYDFLFLPSTPKSAFRAELPAPTPEKLFEPWSNTFLFNLTEQPAASVPCGLNEEHLPIGLQIVGNRFDDLGVLRMAYCCECVAPPLAAHKL